MPGLNIARIEDRFPTIYITLISVLLAVGLEDAISQVRAVESNEFFNWIIVTYVSGTTLAAWTGYSFVAITQLRRPRLLECERIRPCHRHLRPQFLHWQAAPLVLLFSSNLYVSCGLCRGLQHKNAGRDHAFRHAI